jgi:hypothetical protein
METVRVQVSARPPESSTLEEDLQRAREIARWMDTQFNIAGIDFGFDAIIGLIPGIGDLITSAIGLYPIYLARKHNLGRLVQTRMAMNLVADFALGAVPLVGDAFDIVFKAHRKNLAILEKALEKRLSKTSP